MQINRAMAAAGIAAAIIIGLVLLSLHPVPAGSAGDQGNAALPAGRSQTPAGIVPAPPPPDYSRGIPGPGDLWAKVDPVPDIPIGRPGTVTVRGTTNVQPGQPLRIDFIAYSMHPSPMEYHPDLWFSRTVTVVNGSGEAGTWSAEVRPGDFTKPDRWQILVTDVQGGWSIGGGSVNVTA